MPSSLRPALALLLLGLPFGAVGCKATRIPPPPASFDTVVLTSELAANRLYAEGLAAFLRANWDSLPEGTDGLTMLIRPDGSSIGSGGSGLLLRVVVLPLDAETGEPAPDLADPDYAGPDLSRQELEDPARGQNDADSLRHHARLHPTNTGSAVLTATVDTSDPAARDVLIRTTRILAGVSGTLSYR